MCLLGWAFGILKDTQGRPEAEGREHYVRLTLLSAGQLHPTAGTGATAEESKKPGVSQKHFRTSPCSF